jgi:hypothetical protein
MYSKFEPRPHLPDFLGHLSDLPLAQRQYELDDPSTQSPGVRIKLGERPYPLATDDEAEQAAGAHGAERVQDEYEQYEAVACSASQRACGQTGLNERVSE